MNFFFLGNLHVPLSHLKDNFRIMELYYLKWNFKKCIKYIQFSSVTQSRLTLCDPMDYRSPCPITNSQSLLKFMSIHSFSDAIQPSHPLSSPSPPAFNLSQHQGLFKCISSLHQVAKVLEFQLQHHLY